MPLVTFLLGTFNSILTFQGSTTLGFSPETEMLKLLSGDLKCNISDFLLSQQDNAIPKNDKVQNFNILFLKDRIIVCMLLSNFSCFFKDNNKKQRLSFVSILNLY